MTSSLLDDAIDIGTPEQGRSQAEYAESLNKMLSAMEKPRRKVESVWADIEILVKPVVSGQLVRASNAEKLQILDATASHDINILSAGLMSGLSSPVSDWFTLTNEDSGALDDEAKQWLSDATTATEDVIAKSNVYRALQGIYEDCGLYGVGCAIIIRHPKHIVSMQRLEIGTYWIGLDEYGDVSTIGRKLAMGRTNCLSMFGEIPPFTHDKWQKTYQVRHLIFKNPKYNPSKASATVKKYLSVYWVDQYIILEEGFDYFPAVCPRWDAPTSSEYGTSPAMLALPFIKSLQFWEARKQAVTQIKVDPPLLVPSLMRGRDANYQAGGVTYYDENGGNPKGVYPAFQVDLDINAIAQVQAEAQAEVHNFFFRDIFLMIASADNARTATEMRMRREEKMMMLGPVTHRFISELLAPTIEAVFQIAVGEGVYRPAPESLGGKNMSIKFKSLITTAQSENVLDSVDRLIGMIGGVSGMRPDIVDNLPVDYLCDAYASALAIPPSYVASEESVKEIRQARAQAQAAQAQQQTAMNMATAASKLPPEAIQKITEARGGQ